VGTKQFWIPLLGMACVPFSSRYVDVLVCRVYKLSKLACVLVNKELGDLDNIFEVI
jgi:hypothetical protein